MRSSKSSLIAAMSGILAGISPRDLPQRAFRVPRIRTHKRYPEQSSRQAMRAHRRQQGGPGIVLDTATGQYVPRA